MYVKVCKKYLFGMFSVKNYFLIFTKPAQDMADL